MRIALAVACVMILLLLVVIAYLFDRIEELEHEIRRKDIKHGKS